MTENEPGLFQQALFFLAMIGAWIAGEAGRGNRHRGLCALGGRAVAQVWR